MTDLIELQQKAIEVVKNRCKKNVKLKKKKIDLQNISEEISDGLIILFNLADHFKINLESALTNKIEEVNLK